MVALGHIRKFIQEHPQDFPGSRVEVILKEAESAACGGILSSGYVEKLLGEPHARVLFTLMSTDTDYLKISVQAAQAGFRGRSFD